MTLKFWKWRLWRRPEPEALPEQEDDGGVIFLTLTLTPDGRLGQYAFLPSYSQQEGTEAARSFAKMLFLLNDGQLLPVLQRAVATGGERCPAADGFAHLVLANLNKMVAESSGGNQQEKNKGRLVVRPRDTFSFNTHGRQQ